MIEKPTVTELLKRAENRYELVIMTAKRARQLAEGAEKLTSVPDDNNVTVAANEIFEGKVVKKEDEEENQEAVEEVEGEN